MSFSSVSSSSSLPSVSPQMNSLWPSTSNSSILPWFPPIQPFHPASLRLISSVVFLCFPPSSLNLFHVQSKLIKKKKRRDNQLKKPSWPTFLNHSRRTGFKKVMFGVMVHFVPPARGWNASWHFRLKVRALWNQDRFPSSQISRAVTCT